MKALTPKQAAALDYIKERGAVDHPLHVYSYWKDSWAKNGSHDGLRRADLEQLEKKGYIVLHKRSGRNTGVFNPKADSWGYSTYWVDIAVTLTGKEV